MAIIRNYNEYYLECDECGRCVPKFDSFDEALEYAKEMDWKLKRVGNEWWTDCNDCLLEDWDI